MLKIPDHAIGASLGAAAVTTARSLSAASVNPASMVVENDLLSVAFTHTSWIEGTTANHLSVSLPLLYGRAFLMTGMNTVSDIEVRTQPGPASSTFSAKSAVFRGGWGMNIREGIVFAVSASYIYDRLFDVEATGIAGGLGLLATNIVDGASIGVSVADVGSVTGYKGSTSDLPTRLTIGSSYEIHVGEFTFTPAISYQNVRAGASGVHVGATVGYSFLTLRGSYRTGESARSGSLGAAVSYEGMSVEYAMVPFSYGLGSGHLISIGIDL